MSPTDARTFWDIYFRNRFLRLERKNGAYRGVAYAKQPGPPAGILGKLETLTLEVPAQSLRAYDYNSDPRFALTLTRLREFAPVFQGVENQTYPYRAPAPFGKERMAELCKLLRAEFGSGPLTAETARATLLALIAHHTPKADQPIAALVWMLGELGDRDSSSAVLEVIRNSGYVPFGTKRLHFTPVDAAFSALWRINDKRVLAPLLEIFESSSSSGRQKMAALFERLLSTTELLSLDRCGDSYLVPEFWAKALAPFRGYQPGDWDRFDANALFWEIRLLAAERLPPQAAALLQMLAADEVGPVRFIAAHRLQQAR